VQARAQAAAAGEEVDGLEWWVGHGKSSRPSRTAAAF
jgi:hypothetical protein